MCRVRAHAPRTSRCDNPARDLTHQSERLATVRPAGGVRLPPGRRGGKGKQQPPRRTWRTWPSLQTTSPVAGSLCHCWEPHTLHLRRGAIGLSEHEHEKVKATSRPSRNISESSRTISRTLGPLTGRDAAN
jgi:hypothetical protein